MDSGPGWKKTGDGWVLFRPNRWSATYRITEEEHRQVRKVQIAEIWVAILSAIPVSAAWLLWWKGLMELPWVIAILCFYAIANSCLSLRRSRIVRHVTLRAARSATDLEFEPFKAVAGKAVVDFRKSHKANMRLRTVVLGYASLAYGLASVVLARIDVIHVMGLPTLGPPASYIALALGIGILFFMRPWRSGRT